MDQRLPDIEQTEQHKRLQIQPGATSTKGYSLSMVPACIAQWTAARTTGRRGPRRIHESRTGSWSVAGLCGHLRSGPPACCKCEDSTGPAISNGKPADPHAAAHRPRRAHKGEPQGLGPGTRGADISQNPQKTGRDHACQKVIVSTKFGCLWPFGKGRFAFAAAGKTQTFGKWLP